MLFESKTHLIVKQCQGKHSISDSIPSCHVQATNLVVCFQYEARTVVTRGSAKDSSLKETSPAVNVTTRKNKRLPRKHFFSILCHFPAWSFHNLPSSYKDSPFFNLHEKLFMARYMIKTDTLKNTRASFRPNKRSCK